MQGTVKFWNDKGYGFIVGNDGVEYFTHWSNIIMEGYKVLEPGQTVEFNTIQEQRGPKATDVSVCK